MATANPLKLGVAVKHVRRNGEKITAKIVKAEYPGAKGTWIDIQPVNKKGESVGKTISCRPTQLAVVPVK